MRLELSRLFLHSHSEWRCLPCLGYELIPITLDRHESFFNSSTPSEGEKTQTTPLIIKRWVSKDRRVPNANTTLFLQE